jgi:hypothetical protein
MSGAAYERNPKVEEAPLQGEMMLFDPVSSQFFVLNRTMAFLWRHCEGGTTVEGMVRSLRDAFREADAASVESEVQEALGRMVELGLLASVATVETSDGGRA